MATRRKVLALLVGLTLASPRGELKFHAGYSAAYHRFRRISSPLARPPAITPRSGVLSSGSRWCENTAVVVRAGSGRRESAGFGVAGGSNLSRRSAGSRLCFFRVRFF